MILEHLLDDAARDAFLQQHFLRLPFARAGGAERFRPLGTRAALDAILAGPNADVLVVRQGQRWSGSPGIPTPEEARRLHDEGYTLLVRHAERHSEALAGLARSFERDFRAPVDVHIYCTPPSQHGFGWHYDAEDVFILQTEGTKEYSLRKNTVNPWPLAETLPADMRYQREVMPLMKCRLAPGDWLYIPHGYWHVAAAQEPSISLAVGLMMPSALDLLDRLRDRLRESLLWRQRLPAVGAAAAGPTEQIRADYAALLTALGEDLARALSDTGFLRDYLDGRDSGPQ